MTVRTVVCLECEEQLVVPEGSNPSFVFYAHWPSCPCMPRTHP